MSSATDLQEVFGRDGLTGVFVEQLGWEAPSGTVPSIQADDDTFHPIISASLKGFRIYRVPCADRPNRKVMRQVDKALSEFSPERLEVFESPKAWFWHWPRRTNSGTTTFEAVETAPDSLPTFLAQRLTGLKFIFEQHSAGITIADVRARVHGQFDATNVTRQFYTRFKAEHVSLASAITGIPQSEKANYATTLLNRLMFLYFMQKKEFLNGDSSYLEKTLTEVQRLKGKDHYYTFYRDALLPLFFDKLNDRVGKVEDLVIDKILGDVPYVNGGIFGRTDLESEYAEQLAVPDSEFERILAFFADFNWHLDTRPTGNQDEINPEVIGYIFEQYINFSASGKRDNGAYYTPHDVTAHMVAQTLVPRILDDFVEIDSVFALLREDPDRYIQPAMLHGWNSTAAGWIEAPADLSACWEGDPTHWILLDEADHDDAILLPGETWVEAFHRRERVESLRQRIAEGQISQVNDLITDNLNGQLLLTDAIDRLDNPERIANLFAQLTQLSVFDPTCGSGAFLFAALEVLEDIYDHIIDAARSLEGDSAVADVLSQVDAHPSKRYFIRKHIAIRNLYGTDLMPDAIETAKLRIFLALAACVDTREELQPLPDLDFNLKCGNLVVGLKDADDVLRIGGDLLTVSELASLKPQIDEYAQWYSSFASSIETNGDDNTALKAQLREREAKLREKCNRIYAQASGITSGLDAWVKSSQPFHWFCEFPEIIRRGGFDVVIGNPPYVKMSQLSGYTAVGYATSGCPDLYAVCYERSLALTHPNGRHAFIVMASVAFGDQFAALRKLIGDRQCAEWWSTYGKIPCPLFQGVRVRNTVLILAPGSGAFTTQHHIHTRKQREWLFATIEFSRMRRTGTKWPVRGGFATTFLEKMQGQAALPASPPGGDTVYMRPTASYWFPALLGSVPVLNENGSVAKAVDGRLKQISLREFERQEAVIAMLGGKLTYLWWAAIGDDFDINTREADVPRGAAYLASRTPGWAGAVEKVLVAARQVAYVSLNKQWYFNIRWNNIRHVTDEMDRLVVSALGGTDQDWRALNILYRQVMRSSGDSTKGRYVTQDELTNLLKW